MGEFQRLPGPQTFADNVLLQAWGPLARLWNIANLAEWDSSHPPRLLQTATPHNTSSTCTVILLVAQTGKTDVLGKTDSGTAGDMAACISRVQKQEAGNAPISFTLPTCLKFGLFWPLLSLPSHCLPDQVFIRISVRCWPFR